MTWLKPAMLLLPLIRALAAGLMDRPKKNLVRQESPIGRLRELRDGAADAGARLAETRRAGAGCARSDLEPSYRRS
jgi:hypothetical protein